MATDERENNLSGEDKNFSSQDQVLPAQRNNDITLDDTSNTSITNTTVTDSTQVDLTDTGTQEAQTVVTSQNDEINLTKHDDNDVQDSPQSQNSHENKNGNENENVTEMQIFKHQQRKNM